MDTENYRHIYEREDTHWWFRGRRAVLWALLARTRLPPTTRILDAGCGTGRNLVEFGALGPALGVDPSAEAVEYCRRRGLEGVRRAGLEALALPSASFDLILALDVIEHIADEATALRELRRVAAPGAHLLVTVPAYTWLWSRHDDTHHHQRRYTARRLRRAVLAAGWRPQLTTYFNSILLAPIAAVRLAPQRRHAAGQEQRSDYELTPGPVGQVLERALRAEAALIARGGRLPAGVSVAMVCRAQ